MTMRRWRSEYRNVHARLEAAGLIAIKLRRFRWNYSKMPFTCDFGRPSLSTHKVSTFRRASNATIREESDNLWCCRYQPNIVQLAKTARQTLQGEGLSGAHMEADTGHGKEAEFKKLRRG